MTPEQAVQHALDFARWIQHCSKIYENGTVKYGYYKDGKTAWYTVEELYNEFLNDKK